MSVCVFGVHVLVLVCVCVCVRVRCVLWCVCDRHLHRKRMRAFSEQPSSNRRWLLGVEERGPRTSVSNAAEARLAHRLYQQASA